VSLIAELGKATVKTVFLLELTAGLHLRGFVPYAQATETEDWGDLSAATETEDWGDLSAATEFEDWGAVTYSNTYQVACALNVTAVKSYLTSETTLTERGSDAEVELNEGSWYSDGSYVYVRPASGQSLYTYTYRATVAFFFSNEPKIFNDQYYDPRLMSVPTLSLRIESRFSGVGQIGNGTAKLNNGDGYFDTLTDLQWDAGTAAFKMGIDSNATMSYSDYKNIGQWRVESVDSDNEEFSLKLREIKTKLERRIPFEVYTLEDYPSLSRNDIGKPIPRAYGRILGARPVPIDPSLKKFKVANHAIRAFDDVRMQVDNRWVSIPFASTDLTNAEFTLGDAWSNSEPLSVDFWGRKNSDGTLMVNASDIVEDILTYVGESSFNIGAFDESYRQLDIGSTTDFYRTTSMKPGVYLDALVDGTKIISDLNRIVGSYLYIDFDGRWTYRVFSSSPANFVREDWEDLSTAHESEDWGDLSAATEFEDWNSTEVSTFTDADILDDYSREVDSSQIYSKVSLNYAHRKVDGWSELATQERVATQFLHGESAELVKELDEPGIWDSKDATYYAQRLLTTEGVPLTKHKFSIPWQAFFILPGDNIHVTLDREELDAVLEVLEVKHDLSAGKVQLVCGDRRGWSDSFGWWVLDDQAAWSAGDSDATATDNDQASGYWLGEDDLASATDERSHLVSRHW
jgi:hypothetical protein